MWKEKTSNVMRTYFWKADYVFAIFSSLKISVEETSCKERPTSLKGREEERPWCRLTLVVKKLDNYTQRIP